MEEKNLETVEEHSDEIDQESYLKTARKQYEDKMPRHWDDAYAYYTSDDAAPVMDPEDRMHVVNILNHGKYNRKIIRFSIIAFVISIIGVILLDRMPTFEIRTFLKIILILAEAAVVALGIFVHKKNRFTSVHWVLPCISAIWCAYLFFWII
jgi:hypothetical protein